MYGMGLTSNEYVSHIQLSLPLCRSAWFLYICSWAYSFSNKLDMKGITYAADSSAGLCKSMITYIYVDVLFATSFL